MKKIINIILIIGLVFIWSCSKQLDLKPKQSIEAKDALNTSLNVINALNGAYAAMRDDDTFVGAFAHYSEILAATDNGFYRGTWPTYRNIASKAISVDNAQVWSSWRDAYNVIGIVNNVLNALDVVDDGFQDIVEGEALLIRGWTLFELTRLYGQTYRPGVTNSQDGVPIVLKPAFIASDAELVSRNSVEECYAQAIQDLSNAKALLQPLGTNGTSLNTYTASAILSRIYLYQGRYEDAALEADFVISFDAFILMPTPLNAFNNGANVKESIFAFQANNSSYASRLAVIYASLNDAGRGDFQITEDWINSFEAGDRRGQLQTNTDRSFTYNKLTEMYYIGVGSIANYGGINTSKWGNYYTTIPMIRLAEMYLTRAEGNLEAGTNHGSTPLEDINVIRFRSGLADVATVDLASIQDERLKELCFEGHRLHDMRRWQMDIGALPYNDNSLVLPIPLREREVNPNLTQNPGYVE